jgi:circadian clock protein KaiC
VSNQQESKHTGLPRIATGVSGLDQVLMGGLFQGAVYILRGTPGAGKTILANQICFHHARQGGRALFVTLLAENHARMLQHLEQMSFYDSSLIPKHIYYVSAFRMLEESGLKGMMDLLRREMRAHAADLLIVDGLVAVEESSSSDREFRKFIHELQGHTATAECCTLLLTNGRRGEYHPEHTMVDGLLTLDDVNYGKRRQRELEVRKFRGSGSLRGRHPFRITPDGLMVYPRPESQFLRNEEQIFTQRLSMGIEDLDAMMAGGPVAGSTTLLLGASGVGKTTLGTYFLGESSKAEPGLLFGFYETPDRLVANAAQIGLDLRTPAATGHLELIWNPPVERILDSLGNQLIDAVRKRAVKRLFVDGWGGFTGAADISERLAPFFAALSNELRALGVTTLYAAETENLVGPEIRMPTQGVSAVTENLLLLRFAETEGRLSRLISIIKVRGGGFDPAMREFAIGPRGVTLMGKLKDQEHVWSGHGMKRRTSRAPAKKRSPRSARAQLRTRG